jgi:hypothetical protein
MFYRIVLQGRAAGDRDLATVKREFTRVTGMPESVTESLFARAPHPLKERVAQGDAERIAATLRAIGAAVTVERDLLASLEEADGQVHELRPPDHRGPPTIVPGSEPAPSVTPPSPAQRLRRRLRPYLAVLLGALLAIVLLAAVAPFADDVLRALRPARTPPPAAVKPPPATSAPTPRAAPNASMLDGPWRCTDQRTGLSVYWTFGADGSLTFHGDTLTESAARVGDPTIPSGWKFTGGHLVFSFARTPPVSYSVSDLNIARLHYGDGHDIDIQCRRP